MDAVGLLMKHHHHLQQHHKEKEPKHHRNMISISNRQMNHVYEHGDANSISAMTLSRSACVLIAPPPATQPSSSATRAEIIRSSSSPTPTYMLTPTPTPTLKRRPTLPPTAITSGISWMTDRYRSVGYAATVITAFPSEPDISANGCYYSMWPSHN